jgi:histone acetyltransferase SAS3
VFNKLILDGDPMDGSRSLRKRKASDEAEAEQHPRLSRKRRRPSEAAPASAGDKASASATSSPRAKFRVALSEEVVANGDHAVTSGDEAGGSPKLRTRPRRAGRNPDKGLCHVVTSEGISLIVSFNLDATKMQKILASRPRKSRPRDRSRKKIVPPVVQEPEISHYPAIPSGFASQLLALADREQDDTKSKPYGGILSEIEANTDKTFPQESDRKRFEDARLKAEEDWKKKMAAENASQETARPAQKTSGPPSKIKCIAFGNYQIDTWNAAPYPEEYSRNRLLYICEYCLKYMNSDFVAWRHKVRLFVRLMFSSSC